jgi:hypothetical protein
MIEALINSENFNLKDCIISGEECVLITPKEIGVKWTGETVRFRSCIARKSDGMVLSQGLPKFKNWSEDPEFQPWDMSWPIEARHKKDGSLIMCSFYKDNFIIRTRGTVSVATQETGEEVFNLFNNNPKLLDKIEACEGQTFLFEHTSPSRVIVLREDGVPTLTLLGIICNISARLESQEYCDQVGCMFNVPRPKRYFYESVKECILDVEAWEGAEGVVLYSPDGQTLKKIKSASYLAAHRLCTGIKTIGHVIDLFMSTDKFTTQEEFYNFVKTTLDFELAEKLKEDMGQIVMAYNIVLEKLLKVRKFVDGLRGESFTRRMQAEEIMGHWSDWRKGAAFNILDNKTIEDKLIRTAIEKELS